MLTFIGGQNALYQYMNDNLQYPDAVEKKGIEANRITAQGVGATNDISGGWEFNNVVMFFIENANDDLDISLDNKRKLNTEY